MKAKWYKLNGHPPKQGTAATTMKHIAAGSKSVPQLTSEQYQQLFSILDINTPQPMANLTGTSI